MAQPGSTIQTEIPHFARARMHPGSLPIIKDSENSGPKLMELNKNLTRFRAPKELTLRWEAKSSSAQIKLSLYSIKITPGTLNSRTELNSLLTKILHKSLLNTLTTLPLKFSTTLLK